MTARRISPPDDGPGTSEHILTHDGRRRVYRIHVPPVVPVGAPLVLQLHGGGGNGTGLDRLTGFHRLGDRERFVVASPSGVGRRWNDGRAVTATNHEEVDDVGFLVALVDCVAQWMPIDRQRVYVAGISNGAMMAARLAHAVPGHFAAFGQVAGTAAEDAPTWWHPSRPVPLMQIHGTGDPILPYEGGAVRSRRSGGTDRGRVLGVDAWAALVTGHNRAVARTSGPLGPSGPLAAGADTSTGAMTPSAEPAVPLVSHLQPDLTVRRWPGRSPDGDVEFWRVAGGGHTWPGGTQYLPVGIIGTTTSTFDATEALWQFFAAHGLR